LVQRNPILVLVIFHDGVIINSPSLCMPSSFSLAESFDIDRQAASLLHITNKSQQIPEVPYRGRWTICANVHVADDTESVEGAVMENESPSAELERLRKRQLVIRRNEVYGGLSKAERAEYEAGRKRINALTKKVEATASSRAAQAEQRGEWNKMSETDTPQSEARQPYRSREKDSTTAFVDSAKKETVKRTRNPEN
jgi:hypothetical protein